nr:ABC-three component system middle component 1 [Mucilaginibacter oryzae]
MFYLCKSEVSLALKYKIENDRFSSRKIILDNYDEEISDIGVNDIINEHITNVDIIYDPEETKKITLSLDTGTDSAIWDLIKDMALKPGKQSITESEQILSQIAQNIKNEDQQS